MFFFTLNAFPAICSKPCKILESVKGKKDPGTGLSLKNLRNFQAHLLLLQNGASTWYAWNDIIQNVCETENLKYNTITGVSGYKN